MTPLFETAKRLTALSVRMVVSADRMLRNSHTFTVRSSDPETTLSSRVNTVEVTLLKKKFFWHSGEKYQRSYSVCPWNTDTAGI